MADQTLNATVVYREDIAHDHCILRVAPDSGFVPEFEAGQYAEIAIPGAPSENGVPKKLVRRAYSIASPPSERGYVEFFVVLVEDGELTPKLWPQPVGGRLWLGPKLKGKFTLTPIPPDAFVLMIATGTGLAPFVSMIRHHRGSNRWQKLVLLHSACYERDLGYRQELEQLAKVDPTFLYIPTLTRESSEGWHGARGRVQHIFEDGRFEQLTGCACEPESWHVLLCGNPVMIDSMQVLLEGRGFKAHSHKNPGNIHYERYW